MTATRRLAVALALSGTVLAGLVGCGDDEPEPGAQPTGARAISEDEANRLAVARFNNYDRNEGRTAFTMRVGVQDQVLTITGTADLRDHRAVASLLTDDQPPTSGLFTWDLRNVGLLAGDYPTVPAVIPAQGWQVRPLDRSSTLDQSMVLLLNLALDRPENPQLLRQNGAQWRGRTTLDGTEVDLMTATGEGGGQSLTYYVDDEGTLLRVDVDRGPGVTPDRIDLQPAAIPPVPVVAALTAPAR